MKGINNDLFVFCIVVSTNRHTLCLLSLSISCLPTIFCRRSAAVRRDLLHTPRHVWPSQMIAGKASRPFPLIDCLIYLDTMVYSKAAVRSWGPPWNRANGLQLRNAYRYSTFLRSAGQRLGHFLALLSRRCSRNFPLYCTELIPSIFLNVKYLIETALCHWRLLDSQNKREI